MQMARLLLQAHEKTPAGRIRRGFCMKAQDADFFLRALPNGSRMKNSDLVCCFAFRNCYIYEVSKKRRNRRMKQEQVLALYDAYADSVYRVALGYLRSPHDAEDAVQAVFCKLLERDCTVYPGKERAFLTKLTVNHSKNQLTARKRFVPDAWDELVLRQSRKSARFSAPCWSCRKNTGWSCCCTALHGGLFLFQNCRIPAHHGFCRFHAPAQGTKNVG